MIELKDINKIYIQDNKEIIALQDINLKIEEKSIFGIIGYSGAGKSTLVKLLNCLEQPTSGQVIIDGEDLHSLKGKDLQRKLQKIGMVYQHFNLLWSRTVLKNVLLPLEISGYPKEKRLDKAMELIKLVGLENQVNAFPSQLSGGQKQRVGIARALVNDPSVLLCDEATSALDPQTTQEILDLLLTINKKLNLTIIIISHEMDVVKKVCHQIAVIDNGTIVETNDTKKLFTNPQMAITKQFIGISSTNNDLGETIKKLKNKFKEDSLIKLTFSDGNSANPLISQVVKAIKVDISILYGSIDYLDDSDLGILIIKLSSKDVNEVVNVLSKYDVISEVL